MADRYENIRRALEGLRERCAQEAERITARRRTVAALSNNEAMKPCEVAAAIRKIDVQQYCECTAREIERLAEALRELVAVFSESGMYDEEIFDKARAALDQELPHAR